MVAGHFQQAIVLDPSYALAYVRLHEYRRTLHLYSAYLVLFLQLCVFEEPHRFVVKIPKQPELVHEMRIEREAAWQYQLQKPALAQGKNCLARYLGPAEHNYLSISGAI